MLKNDKITKLKNSNTKMHQLLHDVLGESDSLGKMLSKKEIDKWVIR